jgi:hypothetical protein
VRCVFQSNTKTGEASADINRFSCIAKDVINLDFGTVPEKPDAQIFALHLNLRSSECMEISSRNASSGGAAPVGVRDGAYTNRKDDAANVSYLH